MIIILVLDVLVRIRIINKYGPGVAPPKWRKTSASRPLTKGPEWGRRRPDQRRTLGRVANQKYSSLRTKENIQFRMFDMFGFMGSYGIFRWRWWKSRGHQQNRGYNPPIAPGNRRDKAQRISAMPCLCSQGAWRIQYDTSSREFAQQLCNVPPTMNSSFQPSSAIIRMISSTKKKKEQK